MSLGLSSGNLIGRWSLSFSDIDFVNGKPEPARLGLGLRGHFYINTRFCNGPSRVNPSRT